MSHRATEPQRINKDFQSQLWNLKFSLPLWLCGSVAKRLRFMRRANILLLLTFILINHSLLQIHAAGPATSKSSLSAGDEIFLEDLERRMFRYFREQSDPQTGLVPDRA